MMGWKIGTVVLAGVLFGIPLISESCSGEVQGTRVVPDDALAKTYRDGRPAASAADRQR
jgi:hypothetical protein